MTNVYLKHKIRNYELCTTISVAFLIFCGFIAGRFFFFSGILLNFIIGLVLGIIGGIILYAIEYYINRRNNYEKGLRLEEDIAKKLKKLGIKHEPHIETTYGDLDLLIETNGTYYGVEAKNWPGKVTFKNGLLKVDDWDNTGVLHSILMHCKLVRNKKFGESSGKFIKPVLIFGHKADIHIQQNPITFNNVEIIIATIKDFEQYIK